MYLLEVANLVCVVNKVSSFTKEGMHPSGDHNCLNLPLLDGGAREDFIAGAPCHRQRLAGEGGLVDLEGVSSQ